jgi:hypothetical protein
MLDLNFVRKYRDELAEAPGGVGAVTTNNLNLPSLV